MIEPLFAAGSPLWTGVPAAAFAFQPPIALGGPVQTSSVYGAPMPTVPQGLPGASLGTTVSLAPGSAPVVFGPDLLTGLTAPSLLAAVALRRGQPQGPTNDQEVEDFIYDALELLPGAADVDIRCEGGRATLTGSVQHKRLKRDIGEIAWAIAGLNDVQNNVTITPRRRNRDRREKDEAASIPARKQG